MSIFKWPALIDDPLLLPERTAGSEPAIPREDCVLTHLNVGEMPLPEKSALAVALTLLCIFPRIDYIESLGGGGRNAVYVSKRVADYSSKKPSLHLEVNLLTPPPGATLGSATRSESEILKSARAT